MPPSLASLALLSAVAIALVALVWQWGKVAGTTLTGPWWWTLLALALLGAIEAGRLAGGDSHTLAAWRLIALASLFCPSMSLLGAKRPQHHAWHFVVLTLWGILSLPALETLTLRPGQSPNLGDFRGWFVVGLIGLNGVVWWPTRRWLAASAVMVAQFLLWGDYLLLLAWGDESVRIAIAAAAIVLAVGLNVIASRPRAPSLLPWDRVWLDFRDSFGSLWGARVLEQINVAANLYQWRARLGWNGFYDPHDLTATVTISPQMEAELWRTSENLLRRFVTRAWLVKRLGEPPTTG